jgi:radical SAM/Cys-rich protein
MTVPAHPAADIPVPWTSFAQRIEREASVLRRRSVATLQINLGKRCNQACKHCHVDAGPTKIRENMDLRTAEQLLTVLKQSRSVKTMDLTGGAPELNPNFRRMVEHAYMHGIGVIDRCNLTILQEAGQEDLADFLAMHEVTVIASLPCYGEENVDRQRGRGVFQRSIEGLQKLNALGYGKPDQRLPLHLVYNPIGPTLPPAQTPLEEDYKHRLKDDFGIEFHRLLCITNMPIHRFRDDLDRRQLLTSYMQLLHDRYQPAAVDSVMCRDLVSVSWDGQLYDCDFNQMVPLPMLIEPRSIWDIESFDSLVDRQIAIADHCYGCTAGCGSSCNGQALTSPS